jgi:hypothetical protein
MKKYFFKQFLFSSCLLLVAYCLLLSSCEKNITLDLPNAESKIVVEGYVYQDTFPYVFLTKSAPFFSTLDSAQLQQYVVKGAKVIINNGTITDTMYEYQYGQATVYFSLAMKGEVGKTYTLRVEAEGQVLTSTTSIPQPVPLDSLWWKVDGQKDSLGFVWAHLTDPATVGNNYRWFAQRINHYPDGEIKDETFIAPNGSTFQDKFFNGRGIDFPYNRGELPNSTKEDDNNDERGYFKRGDTVVVRFTTIDKANFEFWRSEETQVQNNGNPFANAAPIPTNISGGLGIWGGYGVSIDTVIAK